MGTLNLNTLKDNLQSIFDTANTTTAAQFLSANMNTKVQKVMKINPSKIPIQASFYPCVTMYIDSKEIKNEDIAINQLNAKRSAEIDLKVVGAVWNNITTDVTEDSADNDCEYLMENVEQILRANPTITSFALWSYPTQVTYHQIPIDEEVHLRAGMMNLRVKIFY